ncbi:TVP38/TMEM64 family protein [Henriciella aquimarina]|uniref:TVP38/TMEM64 family protein n=1 Tax=Henriciella aquimarina TaxID=545261 RepID=UPI0009FD3AAD|nr:TVP38/TMEM64 family protein [Henriciella aquimarina]
MQTQGEPVPAARSRKALWLGLAFGGAVILLFVLGKTGVIGSLEAFITEMQSLSNTPWALPAVIGLFTVAAFIGLPQFGLIGAAVVAFGPVNGALYSWIGTMVSGSVTFWLGRFSGQAAVARFSGERAARFTRFVNRNAFAASLIVRNVPTGPFLIVNMAFGAVRANFPGFLAGMALGSIPKILLVTFAGQSLIAAMRGSPLIAAGLAALAGMIFVGVWLYARHRSRAGKVLAPNDGQAVDISDEKAD